jgi:hypothetical protein
VVVGEVIATQLIKVVQVFKPVTTVVLDMVSKVDRMFILRPIPAVAVVEPAEQVETDPVVLQVAGVLVLHLL